MKYIIAFILTCIGMSFVHAQGFLSEEEIYKSYNYSIETISEADPDSVYRIGIYEASRVTIDYKKYKNLHKVTYFVCRDLDLEKEFLKLKENKHLVSVEVYSNRATSFPSSLLYLKNLRNIVLSGMKIDSIPIKIASLTKLEKLHLGEPFSGGIKLKYLPNSLLKMDQLKGIYLWGNMEFVLPDWFYELELNELELTFVNGFDFDKICKMNSLTSLTLEGTNLTNLNGITRLNKLEKLYFAQSNELKTLGSDFSKLNSLKYLELKLKKEMNITAEMDRISTLPNLEVLKLDVDEGIVSLKSSNMKGFNSLLNLEVTALGNKKTLNMANVLSAFSITQKLESLSLSRFNETAIPKELFGYVNLKYLIFSSCGFTEISPQIANLKNMEKLKFWFVPIESLPKALLTLPNLKGIYLGRTKVDKKDKVLNKLYKKGVKEISLTD